MRTPAGDEVSVFSVSEAGVEEELATIQVRPLAPSGLTAWFIFDQTGQHDPQPYDSPEEAFKAFENR